MAKKFKIKNEDPSINFRLPQELKTQVIKEAAFSNKTVSNYLRDHLEEFISGKLFEKEFAYYKDLEFVNSTEFLQLVIFVFGRRHQSLCISTNDQLDRYIQTIKKLELHLPEYLVKEFDKVLVDLIRVRNEVNSERHFYFCGTVISPSYFDYANLESYLLNGLKENVTLPIQPRN